MSWMRGQHQNRNYLFSDGDLGESLRQRLANALQSVDAIPEEQFKRVSDAEVAAGIVQQFHITPLELHEDKKTMSRSETKLDVSRSYDRNPFRDAGPIYVTAVRVVISIPFDGDPDLWRLRPNSYQSIFPRGEIRAQRNVAGGLLDIVIEQPADELPETIKQQLENELKSIRFYVHSQKQQISSEMSQLPVRLPPAITARRQRLASHDKLTDLLGIPEKRFGQEPPTRPAPKPTSVTHERTVKVPPMRRQSSVGVERWDVFVSHASEDKEAIARPLAEALQKAGYKVWYDEFSLTVGDSLRRSIDKGLAKSRFGVVIVSPHFLERHWPQKELDGLSAREVDGQKVILPVWHNVDRQTVANYSPTLADRVATNSSKGLEAVTADLKNAIDRG